MSNVGIDRRLINYILGMLFEKSEVAWISKNRSEIRLNMRDKDIAEIFASNFGFGRFVFRGKKKIEGRSQKSLNHIVKIDSS